MEEQYYVSIKEKLLKSEIYDKARDYAKDRNKVKVYYETGELLSKAGKDHGKNIIKQYSEKLMIEVGKKYNERTLYGMRKFYEIFGITDSIISECKLKNSINCDDQNGDNQQ